MEDIKYENQNNLNPDWDDSNIELNPDWDSNIELDDPNIELNPDWDDSNIESDDPNPDWDDFKNSNALILPSGGIKGIYLIGAIQYLYEQYGLEHIKSYYGCSIGSIISALLIIGYKPLDILVYICIKKIILFLIQSFNLINLISNKHLIDSTLFTTLLSEMITSKIGYIPTLGELYTKFNKKICIVTILIEHSQKPQYISSDSHPDLSLISALHISSSIPIIFGYAIYDKKEYVDGALLDQFPILYASNKEKFVFGIDFYRNQYKKSDNILEDIFNIISLPINHITNESKNKLKNKLKKRNYIELHTNNEIIIKGNNKLLDMFISGYRQCKNILPPLKKEKEKKEKQD